MKLIKKLKVAFVGMGLINSSLARDLKLKNFIYRHLLIQGD